MRWAALNNNPNTISDILGILEGVVDRVYKDDDAEDHDSDKRSIEDAIAEEVLVPHEIEHCAADGSYHKNEGSDRGHHHADKVVVDDPVEYSHLLYPNINPLDLHLYSNESSLSLNFIIITAQRNTRRN